MRTILLLIAGVGLAGVCACSSSPKLADRPGAGTAEAMDQIARRRAEAVRLAQEAERFETTDRARAIQTYKQALGLDDTLHNAWNNLGLLLMEDGNYADAVAAFQVAGDLMPVDPRPPYNIGLAYQRNGWGEEAYRHFAMALERDPSHLPSMRGYIRAVEMTGRADDRTVEIIRSAMMRETDEEWKTYFQRQRYRVEAMMENNR
jgi:tetratricopeptide (TPR) repeat protein